MPRSGSASKAAGDAFFESAGRHPPRARERRPVPAPLPRLGRVRVRDPAAVADATGGTSGRGPRPRSHRSVCRWRCCGASAATCRRPRARSSSSREPRRARRASRPASSGLQLDPQRPRTGAHLTVGVEDRRPRPALATVAADRPRDRRVRLVDRRARSIDAASCASTAGLGSPGTSAAAPTAEGQSSAAQTISGRTAPSPRSHSAAGVHSHANSPRPSTEPANRSSPSWSGRRGLHTKQVGNGWSSRHGNRVLASWARAARPAPAPRRRRSRSAPPRRRARRPRAA